MGPTDRSTDGMRIVSRDHFLGSSMIYLTLLGQCERLSHTACHEHVRVMSIRFLLHDVHRFESPRLSGMSSRLSCGYQHIVKLMN
jgi:hypothetical protein